MTTTMITATPMSEAALYRLMTWLSPAYPVGGFSYSHGLEWAVEDGLVRDRAALEDWIAAVVASGSGRIDGALFAAAWRAAASEDEAALRDIADLAAACRGTRELALESAQQGAAFLSMTRQAWPHPLLDRLAMVRDGAAPLCVVVAAAAAVHGVELRAALTAHLQAFAANLVSAGIRLIPLGQSDGQRITAALEPVVVAAADAAMVADPDAVGAATPMVDWASMKHETQYTRLFRS
jgi:urease accessory protein